MLGSQRQEDPCEFEASLVYRASSRAVGTVQRNPVPKTKTKIKTKTKPKNQSKTLQLFLPHYVYVRSFSFASIKVGVCCLRPNSAGYRPEVTWVCNGETLVREAKSYYIITSPQHCFGNSSLWWLGRRVNQKNFVVTVQTKSGS